MGDVNISLRGKAAFGGYDSVAGFHGKGDLVDDTFSLLRGLGDFLAMPPLTLLCPQDHGY